MRVPRCTVFADDRPWRAWTGAPYRLRDDQLWRPGERGPARPRTAREGDDVSLAGDGLRWRCVFATTREVSPTKGPICTTGCAFQIDVHCSTEAQSHFVDDPTIPWHELVIGTARGRYRANPTIKTDPAAPEYASIDIVTRGDRCWIEVDQLTNRDAVTSAAAVAEAVIRTLGD